MTTPDIADFATFFQKASGNKSRPYQQEMAENDWPETRIIPTGFGKTAAVLAAWLWKVAQNDRETPRRLVYCLPMRTLVEQTEEVARSWISAAGDFLSISVRLDVLLGGRAGGQRRLPEWILNPEHPAILVGTQDMLISAALMRGYGTSRYRWPVDFALLHNDAMWVFDEVQLTGAALATSAQLEAFRRELKTERSSRTLWMSATLDPSWLKTVDFNPKDKYRAHDLSDEDMSQAQHLWTARKRLKALDLPSRDLRKRDEVQAYANNLANAVCKLGKPDRNTILFLNTVARAQAVFTALRQVDKIRELVLIHSRFRASERKALTQRVMSDPKSEGRIVVTTQALEAGVDVTSSVMVSEVAPWSSLVQRFGRCNRNGECGELGADVFWIDLPDATPGPYMASELTEARGKLKSLSACGPADIAAIPPSAPVRGQVIRRRDLLDLFDTDPDLSGFDVDVSPYVRDANDTDVRLFWRPVEADAPSDDAPEPLRDELCPAPIGGAKELVKRARGRAWRWDALAKAWQLIRDADIYPGIVLWIASDVGGYDPEIGFNTSSMKRVEPVADAGDGPSAMDDDRDAWTTRVRVSLARHTVHIEKTMKALIEALGPDTDEVNLLATAVLWHDYGKAHHAWTARMRGEPLLAKSPAFSPRPRGTIEQTRPYFRHELASALAFLAHHNWSDEASLGAYLIAAHHGKVRMQLRSLPKEPDADDEKLFARGVWDGDSLPKVQLGQFEVPETVLKLDIMQLGDTDACGPSWAARTQRILKERGPFRLAWLEALVRIADWRASNAEEEAGRDDL